MVFGVPDCGQWVKENTQPRKAWLLGFMSGMNSVHMKGISSPADPLDKLNTANQMFLWMDNYCKNNPLDSVADGAFALYLELARK